MQDKRNEVTLYLDNITLLLFGILLLSFPLVFTTATTDAFSLPKQLLLATITLASLLFFGARMISEGSVKIRRTPFDLPIFIFGIVTFISSVLSINRFDAFISYLPLFFSILGYFLIVNFVKKESSLLFLVVAFVIGGTVTSLLTTLSFFKLYILPFEFAKNQAFTPLGTLLDQAIYLALLLPVAIYFARSIINIRSIDQNNLIKPIGFTIASIIITIGLSTTIYQLFTTQKPIILPFEAGFQTAFAAISQDNGRVAQGFLFGSGYGTYLTDFTRFKQPPFNINQNLWSLSFVRSSSYILELLATTGVLGLFSFLFLLYKIIKESKTVNIFKDNPAYLALLLGIAATFVLPFSFVAQTTLFILLALFTVAQGIYQHAHTAQRFFDVELYFVAFKKGLFPLSVSPLSTDGRSFTKILPISFFTFFLITIGAFAYLLVTFVQSDVLFQRSLVAASQNNGLQTYNDQTNAITIFPYRDAYYRIYSQTNLAIANSLAANQPEGQKPNQQTQETIYGLIQQSINSARQATTISPLTSVNWQNLSSIYRSLIGFGQNAEEFAVLANQQAIILDPNNPQQYLNLGGLYYQLGRWEQAQNQFQVAVNLKPDFANAYYNLGHALEQKGDLQNALRQYQAVQTLVNNDTEGVKKIKEEIAALEKKLNEQQTQQEVAGEQTTADALPTQKPSTRTQQPLRISTPSAQLPQQNPPVAIPAPGTATESAE